MSSFLKVATLAVLAFGPVRGLACEIWCTNEVSDGNTTITQYPATVDFKLTFTIEAGGGDFLVKIRSSVLADDFFDGQQVEPWYPGVFVANHATQASPVFTYSVAIPSYDACVALAGPDAPIGADGSVTLVNVITADNYFPDNLPPRCEASIICKPAGFGATRTPGWWKNRVDALAACVAGGVDLGYTTVTSVEQALGLLWTDEGAHSGIDKARLKLAKHTLVAYCNTTLFGAVPSDFTIAEAVSNLASTDCGAMLALYGTIDAFNNRFDDVLLPPGFDPGPAYGVAAKRMAQAPVFPAGACSE